MASHQAIFAVSDGLCRLLLQSRDTTLWGNDIGNVGCRVFTTTNFDENIPVNGEVAIFPYRVDITRTQRTLPPTPRYDGLRERHHLPVEIHYLIVPRARTAELQQVLVGWVMRVLEDGSTLPPALLNGHIAGVFRDSEQVELVAEPLTIEELTRIWDQLPESFMISLGYCARLVRIESPVLDEEHPAVLERDLDYGVNS